jgi:hypothetical protein
MLEDDRDATAAVLDTLLLTHLASCRGALALAKEAAEHHWLPAEDDARIDVLARHMAIDDRLHENRFALRVGLTVPGLQRGIHPPLLVLSEGRGGLSKPRLDEAAGQAERVARALIIGRMMRPSLSSNHEQAIRELLAMLPETRAELRTHEVNSFLRLTAAEATRLAGAGLSVLEERDPELRGIGSDLLQRLACFRLEPLAPQIHAALLSREHLRPASLYRDAEDELAERLTERLESPDTGELANHLLRALAWTRSERARSAFAAWAATPRSWMVGLPVEPETHLRTAGWTLDPQGHRRDLVSTTCFQLTPPAQKSGDEVVCFGLASKKCPTCRTPLRWLFEFPGVDLSRLGPAWAAAPKSVLACLVCARFGVVFADYGDAAPSLHRPEVDVVRGERGRLPKPLKRAVSSAPFPPFACAEPFAIEDASTIGGVPMWVQHAEYPQCPRCRLDMLFLGQFDNGSLNEEGLYYAFFCGPCRISAVTYQQT